MRLIDADELKQDFEDVIPNEIVENESVRVIYSYKEEFKLLKESGVSAIQELVQLVAMCNKAIESLDIGGENEN